MGGPFLSASAGAAVIAFDLADEPTVTRVLVWVSTVLTVAQAVVAVVNAPVDEDEHTEPIYLPERAE